ncbi:HVA22-like protein i [Ziziphus jujuba]|uniref:HVA22-like protein n=2 Tax=Ziziphus jujuba TaxID=326968 RepID=A0A6P4AVY0_ZIZJJ|nr:HVA22-like protein i [Ziziphus jujuba]KAH7518492.1 hypothetical protein FEM48_Zijuj09G0177100 [Ziziphus jujuba var. spinosa]
MLGHFLCRAILMVFGYAYPAYKCFKTVENEPQTEHLRLWCHYWIIVAIFTVLERIMDASVPWLPMYAEAKLALFIYLLSSQMKGAEYLYNSLLKPFLVEHEAEIDRSIREVKVMAGDAIVRYWGRSLTFAQICLLESFRYVSSLSALQAFLHPPATAAQDTKQN